MLDIKDLRKDPEKISKILKTKEDLKFVAVNTLSFWFVRFVMELMDKDGIQYKEETLYRPVVKFLRLIFLILKTELQREDCNALEGNINYKCK